jgi:hypothetical protein
MTQTEKQRRKKMEKNKQKLSDLWENTNKTNIRIIISHKENIVYGAGENMKKKMLKHFPNLVKTFNLLVKETLSKFQER